MPRHLYRLAFLFADGVRAVRTHLALAVMTGLTIAVTLLLLGLFTAVYHHLERVAERLHGELGMVVFLADDCAPAQRDALLGWLRHRPEVAAVTQTSKEEAAATFTKRHPESAALLALLEENPLPASLEVHLDGALTAAATASLAHEVEGFAGVDAVRYGEQWLASLLGLSRWLRGGGASAGALLALATLFIVSNQVALSIYARREEIDIMRLIGATNRFIRTPFYLEGALTGLFGGGVAALLLAATHRLVGPLLATPGGGLLAGSLDLVSFGIRQVAVLAGGGALLGMVGCWASIGHFMKR